MQKNQKFLLTFIVIFAVVLAVIFAVTVASLASVAFLAFSQMEPQSQTDTASRGTLRWVREESACTDISVQDDRVILTYSLHFENTSDEDYWVCYPHARFSRLELLGWMEYDDSFSGYGEDGEDIFLVPANDAADIVLIFEGNYLGGPVNKNISLPSLVFMQKDNEDF